MERISAAETPQESVRKALKTAEVDSFIHPNLDSLTDMLIDTALEDGVHAAVKILKEFESGTRATPEELELSRKIRESLQAVGTQTEAQESTQAETTEEVSDDEAVAIEQLAMGTVAPDTVQETPNATEIEGDNEFEKGVRVEESEVFSEADFRNESEALRVAIDAGDMNSTAARDQIIELVRKADRAGVLQDHFGTLVGPETIIEKVNEAFDADYTFPNYPSFSFPAIQSVAELGRSMVSRKHAEERARAVAVHEVTQAEALNEYKVMSETSGSARALETASIQQGAANENVGEAALAPPGVDEIPVFAQEPDTFAQELEPPVVDGVVRTPQRVVGISGRFRNRGVSEDYKITPLNRRSNNESAPPDSQPKQSLVRRIADALGTVQERLGLDPVQARIEEGFAGLVKSFNGEPNNQVESEGLGPSIEEPKQPSSENSLSKLRGYEAADTLDIGRIQEQQSAALTRAMMSVMRKLEERSYDTRTDLRGQRELLSEIGLDALRAASAEYQTADGENMIGIVTFDEGVVKITPLEYYSQLFTTLKNISERPIGSRDTMTPSELFRNDPTIIGLADKYQLKKLVEEMGKFRMYST